MVRCMGLIRVVYGLGVVCAVVAFALSPWPWTAPLPAAAGLIWASYDLIEVSDGDIAPASRRR